MLEHDRLLETVANSTCLTKAPALRRLLVYLWEHRKEDVSEYAIALDVLGKRPQFDPKVDASVRVHISRLRQKLREYFDQEGRAQPFRITIPPGAHLLQIKEVQPESAVTVWTRRLKVTWVPGLAMLLAIIAALFWHDAREAHAELARLQGTMDLPAVWKAILKPGRLTRVIYPIPVFYHWGTLRIRDVRVNQPEGWRTSPTLQPFIKMLGPPALSQSYTVSTDTMAAIQLTRFLSSHGKPLEVSPTGSISLDQYGSDNLIFLGIPPTNAQLSGYMDRLHFRLQDGSGTVFNRKPREGEAKVYTPRRGNLSPGDTENYGVVAVLPGHAVGTSLMLIMGMQTSAVASLLTSPMGLEAVNHRWRAEGSPIHFEVIVRTMANGMSTKETAVAALHRIP